MKHVEERFYQCVDANSFEDLDYVPGDGSTLSIREFGGDGGLTADTVVEIWWDKTGDDESLLFATHGDIIQKDVSLKIIGDGTKKITIRLKNDSGSDICMGSYYHGLEG